MLADGISWYTGMYMTIKDTRDASEEEIYHSHEHRVVPRADECNGAEWLPQQLTLEIIFP
jgi:hypothetical protein